jgi:AmpE protein
MTFIITLISLLIERFFDWNHIRQWRWFSRYQAWLGVRFAAWSPYLLLAVCVLPPVCIVAAINNALTGLVFGILKLAFGILVVVYCFGPTNFWAQFYTCFSARQQEDPQTACAKVKELFGTDVPTDPQGYHRIFISTLFIQANRRIFAVLIWFLLLGPAGAVLYRLTDICRAKGISVAATADKFEHLLDWLPVRIFTLLFALGGHFTQVIRSWQQRLFAAPAANDVLLSECGLAALDVQKDGRFPEDGTAEKETLALLDRIFVIVLVIQAIAVLL